MASADVFKRYEKKYFVASEKYDELLSRLSEYISADEYGKTTICNIYFDTPDFRLIRTSLEGPLYKEKLRIRTYGVPGEESKAFVEIKKKYKGVVYKRRTVMKYRDAINWVCRGEAPSEMSQIMKEIDWTINYYKGLGPAAALFYDRTAYSGKENPEIRITFDENIRARMYDVNLIDGDYGAAELLPEGGRLMEVKISENMPIWLADILDDMDIYPTSYSKYGTAYVRKLENEGEIKNAEFDYTFR